MVGWHHQCNGHEFEQAPRVGDEQGGLACCSPWGCKESDTTERLNNNKYDHVFASLIIWVTVSVNCCSVAKLCPTLCDLMDCAYQASLTFTISWSLLKFISIESVMLSNHLILCHPFLLLPSVFHSIRVFSKELAIRIKWPKYWSFSFSNSPSNRNHSTIDFLQNGLVGSPCNPGNSQESSPAPQFKSINSSALSLLYGPTVTSMHDYWKNHRFDYVDLCRQSDPSAFQYAVHCLGLSQLFFQGASVF